MQFQLLLLQAAKVPMGAETKGCNGHKGGKWCPEGCRVTTATQEVQKDHAYACARVVVNMTSRDVRRMGGGF